MNKKNPKTYNDILRRETKEGEKKICVVLTLIVMDFGDLLRVEKNLVTVLFNWLLPRWLVLLRYMFLDNPSFEAKYTKTSTGQP
jgi:hypothetical protein